MKFIKRFLLSIFILAFSIAVASLMGCDNLGSDDKAEAYAITYVAGDGGYIEGNSQQKVNSGSDAQKVTAIPEEGYEFVEWSDGLTTPERQDKKLNSDINVTAIFEKYVFKVKYIINRNRINGGTFSYENSSAVSDWNDDYYWVEQYVEYGGDATPITAEPFASSRLVVLWSDGNENATRQERNVTSDITLTAELKVKLTYSVANGVGGKIIGESKQIVNSGETTQTVIAVADKGYVFCGWSDLTNDYTHYIQNADRSFDYYAYFEPIEKTFKYDYGIASSTPLCTEITLNRNYLSSADFIIPKYAGYTFCGWFADTDYNVKVVHENGQYMLGNRAFTLNTDTLYAKWRAEDEAENEPTYKLLIVAVDSFKANLLSSKTQTEIEVDYKMTFLEREMLSVLCDKVREYLNLWFDGKVNFEVDIYFTQNTVGEDSVTKSNSSGFTTYSVSANYIPEVGELNKLYHSVLSAYGMNDYSYLLHIGAGSALIKYGEVNIERLFSAHKINFIPLEKWVDDVRNCGYYDDHMQNAAKCDAKTIIETFIHEFVHTCENVYSYGELVEYHKVIYHEGGYHAIEYAKQYLLGEAIYNGEKCGIPEEYWSHKEDVYINYVPEPVNHIKAGRIDLITYSLKWSKYYEGESFVGGDIAYGANITVLAVPYAGYEFVKWSDGVTTALRTDYNIISCLNVKAIFAEIE